MKETSTGTKIVPGLLIIFLKTQLRFQNCFQTDWAFGFQKHVGYAWISNIKPRRSEVFLVQRSPDDSSARAARGHSYCALRSTIEMLRSLRSPAVWGCPWWARCPVPGTGWPRLDLCDQVPSFTSEFLMQSRSHSLPLSPLLTCLTLANAQLTPYFHKPHIFKRPFLW